jgi:hypothetical protein
MGGICLLFLAQHSILEHSQPSSTLLKFIPRTESLLEFYLAKTTGAVGKYDIHIKNRRLGFRDTQGKAAPSLTLTRLIMSGVHKLKEQFGRRLQEKFLRHKQRRLSWVI